MNRQTMAECNGNVEPVFKKLVWRADDVRLWLSIHCKWRTLLATWLTVGLTPLSHLGEVQSWRVYTPVSVFSASRVPPIKLAGDGL